MTGKTDSAPVDFLVSQSLGARVLQLTPNAPGAITPEAEEHGERAPFLAAVDQLERRERVYRRWLAVADGAACLAATAGVAMLANRAPTWGLIFVPVFAILVAKIEGLYDRDDQVILKTNVAEWRTVLQSAAITSIGVYLGWRVLTNAPSGGGMRFFLVLGLITFVLAVLLRSLARRFARAFSPDERCVIVGDPARTLALAQRLDDAAGVELAGMVPEDALTGSVAELGRMVEEVNFHRLVIAPSGEPNASTLHLIQAAKYVGIRVSLVPSVMTAVGGFAAIEDMDGMTLFGLPRFGLSRSSNALKRVFDLVVGTSVLVALAPLMLVLAVLIRLDTPGPVFFSQTRIGRRGQPFRIWKFRSMVDNADALKGELLDLNQARDGLFKIAEDPRITPMGRRIRAAHLDELPQLINVLRGEMSLVGPRPLVAEEDALVTGRDRHRIHLTPGMTGPWQLKGPMNTSLSEMVTLDYRYASSWSIWLDVDILVQTARRVLNRGGH